MDNAGKLVDLVLKAVALAMGVAGIVLGILGAVDVSTQVTLLSIGLFTLALAALRTAEPA